MIVTVTKIAGHCVSLYMYVFDHPCVTLYHGTIGQFGRSPRSEICRNCTAIATLYCCGGCQSLSSGMASCQVMGLCASRYLMPSCCAWIMRGW